LNALLSIISSLESTLNCTAQVYTNSLVIAQRINYPRLTRGSKE